MQLRLPINREPREIYVFRDGSLAANMSSLILLFFFFLAAEHVKE